MKAKELWLWLSKVLEKPNHYAEMPASYLFFEIVSSKKWRPIYRSFMCMLTGPYDLVIISELYSITIQESPRYTNNADVRVEKTLPDYWKT